MTWGHGPFAPWNRLSLYVNRQLLTPRQMCDLRTMTVAYKALVTGEPSELASLFETFSDARSCERVTRQDGALRPPRTRTTTGQRSFSYRAVSLLNKLPRWRPGHQTCLILSVLPSHLFCNSHLCMYVCECVLCANVPMPSLTH